MIIKSQSGTAIVIIGENTAIAIGKYNRQKNLRHEPIWEHRIIADTGSNTVGVRLGTYNSEEAACWVLDRIVVGLQANQRIYHMPSAESVDISLSKEKE